MQAAKHYHVNNLPQVLGSIVNREVRLSRYQRLHYVRWSFIVIERFDSGASRTGELMSAAPAGTALNRVNRLLTQGYTVDERQFAQLQKDTE